MIRTSKKPFPFPLPWDAEQIFMIRAGDLIERGEVEAELAEHGAGHVFTFQLNEAFSAGVRALLGEGDASAQLLELVSAETEGQELPAEERAALDAAREAVRKAWPAYRALLKQDALRSQLSPTISFQRFVTDWQGEGLPPFTKGPDGLPPLELIASLDPMTVRVVGMNCYRALFSGGDEGNSARPLQSDKSQAPSQSDKPAKAGRSPQRSKASRTSSGPKTRNSTSRKGSSTRSTSGSAAGATGR